MTSIDKQRKAKINRIFDVARKRLWRMELDKEELDHIRRLAGDLIANAQLKKETIRQESHGQTVPNTITQEEAPTD